MPYFPKSKKRPWKPEPKPQEGRKVKTNFYHSTAWRKFRNGYIAAHPLCETCFQKDIIKPGTTVDHIKQINREDPYNTKFGIYGEPLDEANVQTQCDHCHAVKSGRERWHGNTRKK